MLPFAALFLRFINFWTVCSFYAFMDIGMPYFLKDILNNIFIVINSSLFSIIGIKVDFAALISEERIPEEYTQNL